MSNNPSAIAFGSINMDLVATTSKLPVPGETLLGNNFFTLPGGKGANQAVALARLGVTTYMVGRVGDDSFGNELLKTLLAAGVNIEKVLVNENVSSGVALINVDDAGENQIIVVPGANGCVDSTNVENLISLLPNCRVLLMQFEIPLPTILLAAQAAKRLGVKVILDPAPAINEVPTELYPLVDIITPNEVEIGMLVGFPVNDLDTAMKATNILLQRGVGCAIAKLGVKGVVCATKEETFFVPSFPVQTVDTVAAGDAFNGALAAALVENLSLRQAVVWGAAAGAIASTISGAQSSLPTKEVLINFLNLRGAMEINL
ncbi:ribokinase [Chlorogloea sp. CCALA 695]|uniref:ribokinase n=1 Tax=Chlorogloea sp. CCALA 695 TaxID=2107693 RepID=UPI000D07F519|nr:ribokinase [Chlorogloea sp. CCALA 695]PSB35400.1 ribokinase [Chlorogloea sp. CCALA 695]